MAKALANITPKAVRRPRSGDCGRRSSARSKRSVDRHRRRARCTSRRPNYRAATPTKNALASRVFCLKSSSPRNGEAVRGDFVVGWSNGGLSHHQHVEDDHRRKAKDHRPYPERPKHVFSGESLLLRENLVSREELLFSKHLVVVSEDLVSEDLVSEDLVSEDLVSEDLVSEDL